jgi:organic radical activating enzyme
MNQPLNQQPIAKQNLHERGLLDLHHMFATIQGEGPFAGVPAVFVRLFGCNLQCPMCDPDYTSNRSQVMPHFIQDAVKEMSSPSKLVVFSGGEPMRQNIAPAVRLLLEHGYRVQIETNGTLFVPDLPYDQITVVCSPKAGKINAELAPHVTALKYVLHANSIEPEDGLPRKALAHPAAPRVARPPVGFKGTVYVQPIDVNDPIENNRLLDAAIRSCLKFGYTLCLQTHKIINLE